MSKAFLCAYVNNNFGDDLFIDIIARRYPETKFYTYGSKNGLKTLKNSNIYPVVENRLYCAVNKVSRVLMKKRILNVLLAKKCDVSVHLGGALFIEDPNWKGRFGFLKEIAEHSERFCITGVNFGPHDTTEYEETHRQFFSAVSDVCFRDSYSCQLFAELGDNIRQAPDVAFCYKLGQIPLQEKRITLVCRSVEGCTDLVVDTAAYVQLHKEICEVFAARGYQISVVSFCEPQGDLWTCQAIYDSLSQEAKKCAEVRNYSGDLNEIIDILGRSKMILAGRFHAMIMGWMLGRKTIPVIYSEKMKDVIHDIQYMGKSYDLREAFRFSADEMIESQDWKPHRLEQCITEAEAQFRYLDEVLGNDGRNSGRT